jgi:hypothetical protein
MFSRITMKEDPSTYRKHAPTCVIRGMSATLQRVSPQIHIVKLFNRYHPYTLKQLS